MDATGFVGSRGGVWGGDTLPTGEEPGCRGPKCPSGEGLDPTKIDFFLPEIAHFGA